MDRSTLFAQGHVPAHSELAYLLESTVYVGELNRMIQFKEKGRNQPSTRASLFTYPALMAADILLYRPEQVPVGDDQRQHVELTRDLALRFNTTYGPVFTVPELVTPPVGARVMDLQDPTSKMGKSHEDGSGIIYLLDPPDVVRRKVGRAVTDSETGPDAVRRDRAAKPGVTNLIDILEACGGSAAGIATYGGLKAATTDAVVGLLEPLQKVYAELAADPLHVSRSSPREPNGAARSPHPCLRRQGAPWDSREPYLNMFKTVCYGHDTRIEHVQEGVRDDLDRWHVRRLPARRRTPHDLGRDDPVPATAGSSWPTSSATRSSSRTR